MLPIEFWHLADRLLELEDVKSPAGYRTVISRAYYAAFHVALRFLDEVGAHIARGDKSHERVPMILAKSEDPEIVGAGAKLSDLRGERNTADYDLTDADVEEEVYARIRLNIASDIMSAISTCQNGKGERYDRVMAATKEYARLLREGLPEKNP